MEPILPPSPLRRSLPWLAVVIVGTVAVMGVRSCQSPDHSDTSTATASSSAGKTDGTPASGTLSGSPAASGSTPGTGQTPAERSGLNYGTIAQSVAGQAPGEDRDNALEMLLQGWVASEPGKASTWVAALPGGDFRQDATSYLLLAWAALDPRAAAAWLSSSGMANAETASTLAAAWAARDPGGATGWVAGLTDPGVRRVAQGAVAAAWGTTDPASASAWVGLLPADERILAATQLAAVWGESDPAAAGAWILRMSPDPAALAAPVASLVSVWTDADPAAVSRWINGLPEGEVRDSAGTIFAVGAAETNPIAGLGWAMMLGNPDQRNQTVSDVCEVWYDSAPDSFRSGIAAALDTMPDALMRKGVYEMLYERDPVFHDNLLKLIEPDDPPPAPVDAPVPDETAVGE